MKTGETLGSANDLLENINGGNASLIYLSNRDPSHLAKMYNEIKAAKQIVSGYFDSKNNSHVLCIFIDGKIKFK